MRKVALHVCVALTLPLGIAGCSVGRVAQNTAATPARPEIQRSVLSKRELVCPPEDVAWIVDQELKWGAVTLSVVPLHPSYRGRYGWVIKRGERPVVVISEAPAAPDKPTSGVTARAIRRARLYLAEVARDRAEGPRERMLNEAEWAPPAVVFTSAYQQDVNDIQIVELECRNVADEAWHVTAKPAGLQVLGGEVWMRFDKKSPHVMAEFGK